MNACFREKFLKDGIILSRENFKKNDNADVCIYEVIRVIDGVCLFLEDHLKRFKKSLQLVHLHYNTEFITRDLHLLLQANNFVNGNIKVELLVHADEFTLYTYYIEHHYPLDVDYEKGVRLVSLQAERKNPNAKMVHEDLKKQIAEILKNKEIYEIALVNSNGLITEGSRSNLFFINENKVYSAPVNMVLAGITRKYVIQAIKNLNINFFEEAVPSIGLNNFDAAFMSGTSPKVLPMNSLDDFKFNTRNPIINSILNEYNRLIDAYIEKKRIISK